MRHIYFGMLLVLASVAQAQPAKSLEQLQREENFRRATEALGNLDAKLNVMVKQREADCEKAVGYAPFCGCLMNDLPIAWSFSEYVAIATRSKEENGYAKMDKGLRAAYDKVAPIRDACVRTINLKQ